MTTRRQIVLALGASALAMPFAALGQATAAPVRLIGVLTPVDSPTFPAFVDVLRGLGYEDGKNAKLLIRSANSNYERLPALARELVDAKVEVIVAINTPGARAAIDATKQIPIVIAEVGDPVGSGFVKNLSRPGGNVTGVTNMIGELASKRLSILHELVPGAQRIAVLLNPVDPVNEPQIRDVKQAAPKLGVEVRFFPVKAPANLPETFKAILAWRAKAAIWLLGQPLKFQPGTIALAREHRLPVMVASSYDVEAGGLISYRPDSSELYRRAATYVDKILKGAQPGQLPVERPTKFELVINLRTAKALGLKIPSSLLARAERVIE